jgi:protein-disulfide isomerase
MAAGYATWCLWCLVAHGLNLLMVCAIWRLCRERDVSGRASGTTSASPDALAGMTLTSREAIGAIGCALVLIAALWAYRSERLVLHDKWNRLARYKAVVATLRQDPDFLLREHRAQPKHVVPLRPDEGVIADAPQVVVFTDFQCPACDCVSRRLRTIAAETFGGNLSILVRHYPLCSRCNDRVKGDRHKNACQAAWAAEAARLLGGTEAMRRMHDLLVENRNHLSAQLYRNLATQISLDPDLFEKTMGSRVVRDIIASDIALARRMDVKGTPTLFVDGRRVTDVLQTPCFWQALADVRAPARNRPTPTDSLSQRADPAGDTRRESGQ